MARFSKIITLLSVLALAGCASCFPSMESREQAQAPAKTGTIPIPGDPPATQ